MSAFERTERGFVVFHEDEHLTVVESSLAFEGPHVRISGGRHDDGHVQLSYGQAVAARDALAAFVVEADAGRLTERAGVTERPEQ